MRLDPADPADATVLFGAGLTRAIGGPTAFELIDAIAQALVVEETARQWIASNIQPNGELRFETAIDELAGVADPDLEVLDLFRRLKPGFLHMVLAWASSQGARLVTVNFDDLVEQAIMRGASTVDLQEGLNLASLEQHGAVVKLHGTQRIHDGAGGVEERGSSRLQATVASIVSSGGGAGLRPDVEERLQSLVAERVLLVVGYSGSDDLDVMPSLERCSPSRVMWVQHSGELTTGASDLVAAWQRHGVPVDVAMRPTEEVLTELGWPVEAIPDDDLVEEQQRAWLDHVRMWAARARVHDPTGMAWVSELQGTLGRFDLAQGSLEQSRPSLRPDGLWPAARRLFRIAENAYLLDVPLAEVRRLAKEAVATADGDGDAEEAAHALHLVARTYRMNEPPDLPGAREALDRAQDRLQGIRAPGLLADILLEHGRIELADDDYRMAALLAGRAADGYRSAGHYQQLSEALQVRAHAFALDGEHEDALEVVGKALRISRNGPYPERQIAAWATATTLADDMGRIEDAIDYAQAAIKLSERTQHRAELAQAYAYLGLSRSEQGRFVDAATAFRQGLAAVGESSRTMLPILVCGLAGSLLRLDQHEEAQRLLDEFRDELEGADDHRLYMQLLRWAIRKRRGESTEWDDRTVDDAPFNGEMTFALAHLAPLSPGVQAYLDRVREHLVSVGQHDRLARLARACAR